jgi:hypothetical protein
MLEPASIRAAGMAVVLVLTASGARGDALGLGQRPAEDVDGTLAAGRS